VIVSRNAAAYRFFDRDGECRCGIDVLTDSQPLVPPRMVELDPRRPDRVNLADRGRVVPGRRSTGTAQKDVLECPPLLRRGPPSMYRITCQGGSASSQRPAIATSRFSSDVAPK